MDRKEAWASIKINPDVMVAKADQNVKDAYMGIQLSVSRSYGVFEFLENLKRRRGKRGIRIERIR